MSSSSEQAAPGVRLARWRIWMFAAGSALMLAAAGGYSLYAAQRHTAEVAASPAHKFSSSLPLSGAPKILYVYSAFGGDQYHLVESPASGVGTPSFFALDCERAYAAGQTVVCLGTDGSLAQTQYADVYRDVSGRTTLLDKVELSGNPSRARVSADGRLVAWTVFVSGDSYNGPQFSTRTSLLDLKTGTLIPSLETFTASVDGEPYHAVDINYWGITFEHDDEHFYVTLGSAGKTWLMRGDLATHTLSSVIENVECPSLSPDGTRIVFKKRISGNLTTPWRLYVLDLATLKETPLAETRSIDDQAAWLDDDTVMYQVSQTSGHGYDIWEVPADGTGTPRMLIHNGSSPDAVGGS